MIVYIILFDSNGGSEVANLEYSIDLDEIELPTPTREGYKFIGWYENDKIINEVEYKNYNLVAKWEEIDKVNIDVYEENGYKYVNFGKYPQTVVTDESIVNALSIIEEENEFGYLEYNGNEYKKMVANTSGSDYTFINGNAIEEGKIYYFLVEPIKWRILEEKDGTYRLLSEMILDNTNFYHSSSDERIINGKTIYANNYEYSNVRAWLNGYDGTTYNVDNYTGKGFLNIAFTKKEQQLISTTIVDNSLESTKDESNNYICNDTTDKIYLLSRNDVLNENIGFNSDYLTEDEARRAIVSDFARTNSCVYATISTYYGNGFWWIRSPYSLKNTHSRVVNHTGSTINGSNVNTSYYGIRASLTISSNEKEEFYVFFKDYDGRLIKNEIVKRGESANPPLNPNREHYSFIGWDVDYSNIQKELIVTAKYCPISYTIYLDSDGGEILNNISFSIEDIDICLPTPSKEGYDFIGWYEEDELIGSFEYRNYYLKAKWVILRENINIDFYTENDIIYTNLGKYPQTVVSDELVIQELSKITETNDLGYIEYNGSEYKKLIADIYNPGYTFINGDQIIDGNVYYFKVEPIKWRVLESNNGVYQLLSEIALDNVFFYLSEKERVINGQTIYANNYEYSNVRAWLNGYDGTTYNVDNYTNKGFLNIAFSKEEQLLINNTFVNNGLDSTGYDDNPYICNDTLDKIYLLSYKDMINATYGFSNNESSVDLTRRAKTSDYVRCNYCYIETSNRYYGNVLWWLRSPNCNYSNSSQMVSSDGLIYRGVRTNISFYCVRPAITITI